MSSPDYDVLPPGRPPRPKLVVLAGPTGVGKTDLAITLAGRFGAEIINTDSMQVYRYMDIGTAKPTPEEQARARHHLIDLVDPDQPFDAALYLRLARPLIAELSEKKIPILVVGGTGLYLRSLLQGLFPGPSRSEPIRQRLHGEAEIHGRAALYARLAEADPAAAERIHPHDLVRIIRALEVYEATGRPISDFQAEHALRERPYQVLFFCLSLPRDELYARIETRTREMFRQGLVREVEGLLDRGFSPELRPMQAIGYRQVIRHIQGRLTLAETQAEIIKQTRRYAKRQLTWFKAQPEVRWRSPQDTTAILEEAGRFFSQNPGDD